MDIFIHTGLYSVNFEYYLPSCLIMKKIAIPVEGEMIFDHFGGASTFRIYSTKDREIISSKDHTPPPHEPGVIPSWIHSLGVTDLLVGGIGPRAVNNLEKNNIVVTKGVAPGMADEIIRKYLNGELEASGENCNHDHHHHHHHHKH